MPAPLIYGYENSQEVANSVADYVVKIQNETLATKSKFNVAVSGGSLIAVLRKGLIDRSDVQWGKW
jgi:6-phosphogluconolactonase